MPEKTQEHPEQNIVDALELALGDADFRPMPVAFIEKINESNSLGAKIISGSVREKHAYDFESQSVVHVMESFALIHTDDIDDPADHRLVIWWEGDSQTDEFSLDDMAVIFNMEEEITDEKIASTKQRFMQALKAVMADVC